MADKLISRFVKILKIWKSVRVCERERLFYRVIRVRDFSQPAVKRDGVF